jgi:hypothetical protein
MSVTITSDGAGVTAITPYDPEFVTAAKDIGGTPLRGADGWRWMFDTRDEAAVRALCLRIFGADGSTDADDPTVTIRVPVPITCTGEEFRAAGITLVRRPARDASVRYGTGVVVISGGFPSSGGSRANPRLEPKPDTTVEVRDLPRGVAEKILAEIPGATLVGDPDQHRAALLTERAALTARLAEIDQLLATTQPA